MENGPYETIYDSFGNIFNWNFLTSLALTGLYFKLLIQWLYLSELLTYQEPTSISHNFVIDRLAVLDGQMGDWNGSGGVGPNTTYSYLGNAGDTTYSISNVGVSSYLLQ